MRIAPKKSEQEYRDYVDSVSEKMITGGQASLHQIQSFYEQNTDRLIIDRKARKIKFLGQFDVVLMELPIIYEQILLAQEYGLFSGGLPPVETVE